MWTMATTPRTSFYLNSGIKKTTLNKLVIFHAAKTWPTMKQDNNEQHEGESFTAFL